MLVIALIAHAETLAEIVGMVLKLFLETVIAFLLALFPVLFWIAVLTQHRDLEGFLLAVVATFYGWVPLCTESYPQMREDVGKFMSAVRKLRSA